MTGLARREVGVVEVEIADKRPVAESCAVGSGAAAADQCAERAAAELVERCADSLDRWCVECPERTPQRVEHPKLERIAPFHREVGPGARDDETRKALDHRHRGRLPCRRQAA